MKNNLPDLEDTNYKIIQVNALLSYVGNDLANLSDAVEKMIIQIWLYKRVIWMIVRF